MKLTLLQSFTPDAVTATFKVQHLALVSATIDKDEQLPTQRVFIKGIFHQGDQAVV